ncbi:hypothetical protein BDF19DRAFT_420818 [Syncephalis fuscata]|nr:hypothetical protein BDF19DRAFT_420818 [Syncephalis fuscata]
MRVLAIAIILSNLAAFTAFIAAAPADNERYVNGKFEIPPPPRHQSNRSSKELDEPILHKPSFSNNNRPLQALSDEHYLNSKVEVLPPPKPPKHWSNRGTEELKKNILHGPSAENKDRPLPPLPPKHKRLSSSSLKTKLSVSNLFTKNKETLAKVRPKSFNGSQLFSTSLLKKANKESRYNTSPSPSINESVKSERISIEKKPINFDNVSEDEIKSLIYHRS